MTLIADLSGLETLLRAHVEREERFLLPLLESEAEGWTTGVARLSPGIDAPGGSGSRGRTPGDGGGRPGRPVGVPCLPGLARRSRPGVPARGLRPAPTLQHYDPEAIDYWVTEDGRGSRRTLTHDTPMPRSEDFSWGLIRLVDRLGVSNEYLTFGGHLDAALIDDVVVAAFASPAPLLRRGGHSQGWDDGADAIGGFFARMMVAVDFKPGFERSFAEAEPLTRYAAFVRDSDRRRLRPESTSFDDALGRLVRHEANTTADRGPERVGCRRRFAGRRRSRLTFGTGACLGEMLIDTTPDAPRALARSTDRGRRCRPTQ